MPAASFARRRQLGLRARAWFISRSVSVSFCDLRRELRVCILTERRELQVAPENLAVLSNHEHRPARKRACGIRRSVLLRDIELRIGRESKRELHLLLPRCMARDAVARDRDDDGARSENLRVLIAKLRELVRAARRSVCGIKGDHDGLSLEIAQLDRLYNRSGRIGPGQCEIRGDLAYVDFRWRRWSRLLCCGRWCACGRRSRRLS